MRRTMMEAGFSEREARVYASLIQIGEVTVDDCAKDADLPRATTYRAIQDLLEKGLIGEITGKPLRYFPVSSKEGFGVILQKKMDEIEAKKAIIPRQFEKLIEEALAAYSEPSENSNLGRDFVVLHGKETIRNEMRFVIHETRKSLYREPLFFPSTLEFQYEWVKQYKEENIPISLLIESDLLKTEQGLKKAKMYLEIGHEVRHLPTFPGKMEIFDEKFALLAMRYNDNPEKQLAILINNQDLVGLLNRAFDSLWEEANPVTLKEIATLNKNISS